MMSIQYVIRYVIRSAALTACALLLQATLPGCTYLDERRDLMAGGPQQREQAAQARLDADRQQAAALSAQQTRRQQELDDVNQRLHASQSELDTQDRRLAAALKARKISQARYEQLKQQTEALKAETAQLKASADRGPTRSLTTASDPNKLRQLDDLDRRRHELENALQAAVGK